MVALHTMKVSTEAIGLQPFEHDLFDRLGFHTHVLHGKNLGGRIGLQFVFFRFQGGQKVFTPNIDQIWGYRWIALVLQDVGQGFVNLVGDLANGESTFRNVIDKLGQFHVGVILGTKAINLAAFVGRGVIHHTENSFGDVAGPYGLGQGFAFIHDGHGTVKLPNLGKPIQQTILSSKDLSWTNNGSPRINTLDDLFAFVFGTRPCRLGRGGGRSRRHVHQMIHLHIQTNFGECAGPFHIGILEGIIGLVGNVGETTRLDGLTRFVIFTHHVDHNIGIGNYFTNRILITRTVEYKSGTT
mmetsp:Transcript_8253/g.15725  ORF Transcript_8253/g.15725 Transcript_8253/m.15725 type:complete len:298 (+) Transcript_8253:47-940(+)